MNKVHLFMGKEYFIRYLSYIVQKRKKIIMKKATIISILIIVITSLPILLSAQDDALDKMKFGNEYAPGEKAKTYFGIGLGYSNNIFFANNDDINIKLEDFGFKGDAMTVPMYLHGFELFTSIPFANLTLGFSYKKGSESIDYDELNRYSDFSVSFTGLYVDYIFVPFNKFSISLGMELGEGKLNLEIYQSPKDIDWNNMKPDWNNESFYHNSSMGFIYLQPKIDFEYILTNWIMTRFNISYNFAINESGIINKNNWSYNNSSNISNVPSTLGANGLTIQLGIFVGLYSN